MELDAYITDLVSLFRECRRVLAADGTFWLNIGDSFTSGGRTWRQTDSKNAARGMDYRAPTPPGLKPKDLIGVPWKLAFALQADGWYLRTDIVWHKPNGQPESVKDRPTRVHEFVFLFSKNLRYFYDWDATKEPVDRNGKNGGDVRTNPDGKRALRSVWSINTEPTKDTNFAVFPPSLVRPCIRAGSEIGDRVLDPFMGSGTTGIVALELGRDFVGVELSSDIAEVARKRIWSASRYAVPVRSAS
jgi:site-specific DNA-methyltransferase (adenine-specific)/site-specific DNA-methyltransferase (cytosine-N4-specific)